MRRATICILTYGDYLAYFGRCLNSILEHTPWDQIELRLGFNDAPDSFAYAQRSLGLQGDPLERRLLADTVERTSWLSPSGILVHLWNSPVNLFKEPMARHMFHETPLATEYVVWFDDDSLALGDWWRPLCALMDKKTDYFGQRWWVFYLPGQTEMIEAQPWYRGVPFAMRQGQPGVFFMTGGFVTVRSERLREADFPDVSFGWKGDALAQYGGDTLLGEIAWQLGWTQADHSANVLVNVDLEGRHPAPRRGGTGRQFGANVDVRIQ